MLNFFKNLFGSNTEILIEKFKSKPFLIDVRTPSEFARGSVNGAVNIPLDKINSQVKKLKGKENIIVFCRSGNRSGMAKGILEQNGITDVVNGGSWKNVQNVQMKAKEK